MLLQLRAILASLAIGSALAAAPPAPPSVPAAAPSPGGSADASKLLAIAKDSRKGWRARIEAIESLYAADPVKHAWPNLAAEIGVASLPRRSVDLGGGVAMEFVFVGPGSFTMGSPDAEAERFPVEGPLHRVEIKRGFWLGVTEVTQRQYQRLMGANPSHFRADPSQPVETVGWDQAVEFCDALSKRARVAAGLPSESQWEYACRAGSTTAYAFGATAADLDAHAWHPGNAGRTTHPVGGKRPNAWGLFDMHGNVWEWCEDRWHPDYGGSPADGSPRSVGTDDRVQRGGSWKLNPRGLRSASRYWGAPTMRYFTTGFRVRLDP